MSLITVVQSQLSGSQIKSLRQLIVSGFTLNDLRILAREEFEQRLEILVNENQTLNDVAFDLISKLERDGGIVDFVNALVERKPKLQPMLEAILANADPLLQLPQHGEELRRFGADFNVKRSWLSYLSAYKGIHEALHNLSGKLSGIKVEVETLLHQQVPIPEETIDDLRECLAEVHKWVPRTEFPANPPLSVWVPKFERAIEDLQGADPAKQSRAFDRIASLPSQQLGPLNSEMVACVLRMELEKLVELLDNLPNVTRQLTTAIVRFRTASLNLQTLIRDHGTCQQIDTELQKIQSLPVISTIDLEQLETDEIEAGLNGLDANRPGVRRTHVAAQAFFAAPTSD